MATEIVLSGKAHKRKKLGPAGRRLRNISLATGVVLFVSFSVSWAVDKRKIKQAQIDISRISHATRLFRADFNRCPAGVDELFSPPEGGAYLKDVTDPWGRPYQLECPSLKTEDGVDVVSKGPDGGRSPSDDIRTYVVEITQ